MEFPRCVYAIRHDPTGKIYIGSSHDVLKRMSNHFFSLKRGAHQNKAMQDDCIEHGFFYTVFIIDTIYGMNDKCKESFWMEALNTRDPEHGYNCKEKTAKKSIERFECFSIKSVTDLSDGFKEWLRKEGW